MRPAKAKTDHHKTHGDLISKVSQDIHDPRQIWSSFARFPTSDSSKIWQSGFTYFMNEVGKVLDLKLKIHFYDWNELCSFSQSGRHLTPDFH